MTKISKLAGLAIVAASCASVCGGDKTLSPAEKEFWGQTMSRINDQTNRPSRVRELPKDYASMVKLITEARGIDAKRFFEEIPNPLAVERDKFSKELKLPED